MPINELIAGGIKLPQFNLPDYGADLAQMAQIQSARNQNALAQYQLGAAQRAEAKDVARTNALLSAGTDEDAIAKALLNSGDITGYSAFLKAKEERQKTGLQIKESESKLLSDEIARSAEAMAKAQTIEEYEAIHNQVHDPKSITGKYFKSIGFNPSSANQAILKAKNDPTGQEFLKLRAQSGLKGKEFADFIFNQAQEEAINAAKNLRPFQPAVAAQPPVVESGQPMVGVQQYMPVSNALAPQIGGPDVQNAMVAKAIPSAAAPSTAQTPVSTNRFDSEITGLEQKIAAYENVPGEKARKLVDDLVKRRDKLVDQRRQESADTETKRAAEVREKLEREKHQLEIDKFNASQKEFKVEKTPQGLVQINKDGTVAFILGADGKQVQSLEFAKSEIKTNADGNYIAFNPYTNESRIITGADGKPVRSLDAATKAEQERHNRELERQGQIRIGQENRRIQLAQQQAIEPKYNAERGGFVYPPSKENPEGRFVPLTGGDGKPLTEGQGKSTAYGLRMTEANQILEKLANEGTERAAIGAGAPYGIGAIVNKATASPQQQQVYQAKLNFITANLRQESGAVIGESEFETEDKKYFPQIGDSPEVLAQKKRARQLAIKAMEVQAGPGAKEIEKFRDSSKPSAAPSGSPKIGSVQEGYKFKGGDPANPKNWEKL